MHLSYLFLLFIVNLFVQIVFCDPFFAAVGSILYELGRSTVCKYKECCTEEEIPADFIKLEVLLKQTVYGQDLVHDTVVNALQAHWAHKPEKALTLSLHGGPGTGKNFVTSIIVKSLYKKGIDSKHVHFFMGRLHFPLEEKTEIYKRNLYDWIEGNVSRCERQIFIFDEVDKMPPKVLDILKPIIDYHSNLYNAVEFRQSVFIFISNTGSSIIAEKFLKLWELQVRREDLTLKDFESLIRKGAFNEIGGFHFSDTIKSNLIDHFIPFLPLEYEHIVKCVEKEFDKRGVSNPSDKLISEVMETVEWGPDPSNIFAKTGCKRLSQKVALTIQRHRFE